MVITMKTLITCVFTIFFAISFVQSRTTRSGYGMLFDEVECFGGFEPCHDHGNVSCTNYCKDYQYDFGVCTQDRGCCCHGNIPK
ncbi:PREDICTED: defensin-like protein 199 [Camelina sativa]|uniref:Defensin-like protein 199 n=1 Tax=Camelina sativa TaxID=90675 RepID=A0ABM1RPG5_CAMSA|nr:PREDICTED: defensin-like protein 199 [Camelina sativa]